MAQYDAYLSGIISNDKNYKKKFDKWEVFIWTEYPVKRIFNPSNTVLDHKGKTKDEIWKMYLEKDIPIVCQCKIIFMLPWWIFSRGARFERYVAKKLGKKIVYLKNKQLTNTRKL